LGNIGTWGAGATPSRSNPEYYKGNIPWLKTGDLNDGYIIDIPEHISQTALEETSAKLNPSGSVLIAMYGATIGKLGILTYPATTNQACCACISYNGINNLYLFYFLMSQRKEFIDLGVGGAQSNISKEKIINTLIPIPSNKEQNNIVKQIEQYLEYLQNLDLNKNNLQELIKLLKKKILDLAIRGKLVPQDPNDEPADVLLERIRKEKEKLIKQGKIKRDKKESIIFKGDDNSYYEQFEKNKEKVDEEIPFNIPDSWQWVRLGSYAQKITDYVASGSFSSLRENVPVLKNKDYALMVKTADFSNNFTQNLTYTTEQGYNYLENSNLFGGELILSNIGSIGKVFIVPELDQKMTLAPNTVMVKLLHDEYRDYVYNFLLSPLGYSQLLKISGGTGIAKFNKTDLKTLLLPIPPIKEQERIIKQIKVLFDLLSEMENSIK